MSALTPNRNLQNLLASSPLHRDLVAYFEEELAKERELYENTAPASEFTRGRIKMLRDIHEFVAGKKKK